MRKIFFSIFTLLVLGQSPGAHALCTTAPTFSSLPTNGQAGQISLSAAPNKLMYCDGTTWRDFGGSPTVSACTKNGEITRNGANVAYCNGALLWNFDSGAATNGACAKVGEFQFTGTQMEFCNGTDWRLVSTDTNVDAVTFTAVTGAQWFASYTSPRQRITGHTGGTANLTTDVGTCAILSSRVCADSACAQVLNSSTTSLTIPNGSYIEMSIRTHQIASTTCTVTATLGASTLSFSVTTAATDDSPNLTNFTMVRSATLNSWSTSSIVRARGHSGVTVTLSDLGTGGTPEVRTCTDSACASVVQNWTTGPANLNTDEYLQVRTFMDNTSADTKKVDLTAGSVTETFTSTNGTCASTVSLTAGQNHTCICGEDAKTFGGSVHGTLTYRQTSDICRAAIHAGAVSNTTGGSITLRGSATNCTFTGSSSNGITSASSATSASAFYFPSVSTDICH